MGLIVIYNPASGDNSTKSFFDDEVFPLLEKNAKTVDKIVATESASHAGQILIDFLESTEGQVEVILGSGDGTLHDIINVVSVTGLKGSRAGLPPLRVNFVIVPCGTANALYSSLFPPKDVDHTKDKQYRLQSLNSFIDGGNTKPLTLAITTLSAPPSAKKPRTVIVSAVVTSTAFHAAILLQSEKLRKEMPGLERYKAAAQQTVSQWYDSSLKLLPAPLVGIVQIYDPADKTFTAHEESHHEDPIVDVDGPFIYFISTVNVDRLEPTFRVTPLVATIIPEEATLDILIVRPERDPSFKDNSEESRKAFETKMWTVLQAAYKDGNHINLRYAQDGSIISEGKGPTVVEYVRCGGWEWTPYDTNGNAQVVCADGSIVHIEEGGRAVCNAATPAENTGFHVYT